MKKNVYRHRNCYFSVNFCSTYIYVTIYLCKVLALIDNHFKNLSLGLKETPPKSHILASQTLNLLSLVTIKKNYKSTSRSNTFIARM